MDSGMRGLWVVYGVVLLWRLILLVTTAQPIPANDAFPYDGAVIQWVLHGHYINPSLSEAFPVARRDNHGGFDRDKMWQRVGFYQGVSGRSSL